MNRKYLVPLSNGTQIITYAESIDDAYKSLSEEYKVLADLEEIIPLRMSDLEIRIVNNGKGKLEPFKKPTIEDEQMYWIKRRRENIDDG